MADVSETMERLMKENDSVLAGSRQEGDMAESLSKTIHLHGLETIIQDFSYAGTQRIVIAAALLLVVLFAIISCATSGALSIVMAILALAAGVICVLEMLDKQVISQFLRKMYSQNVIARHPAATPAGSNQKTRPIVVLAHYDVPCADFMATPGLRKVIPYAGIVTYGSFAAVVVLCLLQLLPLPHVLASILFAITIVASIVLVLTAVRIGYNYFFSGVTAGANDNMSSVAALLGLLDRVHPTVGSEFVSAALRAQDEEEAAEDFSDKQSSSLTAKDITKVRSMVRDNAERRSRMRDSRIAGSPVRRNVETLRALGMVPETCEIVYETDPTAAETVMAPAVTAEQAASAAKAAAAQSAANTSATSTPATAKPAADSDATTVVAAPKAETTSAGANAASASGKENAAGASASVADKASGAGGTAGVPQFAVPSVAPSIPGATTVLTHENLRAAQQREQEKSTEEDRQAAQQAQQAAVNALAPEPSVSWRPLDVIISSDEPDAELRQAPAALPHDVAQQQEISSEDARRDSILNNPNWGTTSFTPVVSSRRMLEDLPDPSVAAVDPFSVSTVETIGDMDPDDFSSLNFETGTHEALTPQMIEEARRASMDGFDSLDDDKRKSRRDRKHKRTERISRRAEEMQQEMEQQSFSDWLGVDEDYDAQKNGRQIGSWDNFADDASGAVPGTGTPIPAQQVPPVSGAPAVPGVPSAPSVPDPSTEAGTGAGTGAGADPSNPSNPSAPQNPQQDSKRGASKRWQGGATRSSVRQPRAKEPGDEAGAADPELRAAAMSLGDADLVSHEIWFVFTGASESAHAGAKAFIKEYDQRLHNAYFINLECVGAGRQSLILEEGDTVRRKADRRLVNLIGTASADLGRPLALDRMGWRDTELTPALRRGRHGVTICGVEDGGPAHARWSGDEARGINLTQISDLVDILVEAIRRS